MLWPPSSSFISWKWKKITIQVGLQHLQGGAARVAKLKPYNYALLVFNHFWGHHDTCPSYVPSKKKFSDSFNALHLPTRRPIVPLEIGFFCHSGNGKVRENKMPTSFLSTSWFWYYDSNFSWSTVIYVMLPFHGSYFSYHTLIIVAWPWLLWRKFQGFIKSVRTPRTAFFLSLALPSI